MNGGVLTQAISMNRQIIESGGFNTSLHFVSDTEDVVTADIQGEMTFHNLGINPETGEEISARQVHMLIHLGSLVDISYPVFRDEKNPGEAILNGDLVTFSDANSSEYTFRIIETRPSNTFGSALLFFEDYDNGN